MAKQGHAAIVAYQAGWRQDDDGTWNKGDASVATPLQALAHDARAGKSATATKTGDITLTEHITVLSYTPTGRRGTGAL